MTLVNFEIAKEACRQGFTENVGAWLNQQGTTYCCSVDSENPAIRQPSYKQLIDWVFKQNLAVEEKLHWLSHWYNILRPNLDYSICTCGGELYYGEKNEETNPQVYIGCKNCDKQLEADFDIAYSNDFILGGLLRKMLLWFYEHVKLIDFKINRIITGPDTWCYSFYLVYLPVQYQIKARADLYFVSISSNESSTCGEGVWTTRNYTEHQGILKLFNIFKKDFT